ncbi:MAG TPA: hypothetical protein VJ792_06675 [Candidatus Nitrosotalea sp.]|nr:hypothetical protein [Candidatus Nitrosotalea sp.]
MNRKRGLITGIILAISSGLFFVFIGFPSFIQQPNDSVDSPFTGSVQSPDALSTISSDIDACISSPTADCDQEMQQISKFCSQNKGQEANYPFCADSRVQMYLEHRNVEQSGVNAGGAR